MPAQLEITSATSSGVVIALFTGAKSTITVTEPVVHGTSKAKIRTGSGGGNIAIEGLVDRALRALPRAKRSINFPHPQSWSPRRSMCRPIPRWHTSVSLGLYARSRMRLRSGSPSHRLRSTSWTRSALGPVFCPSPPNVVPPHRQAILGGIRPRSGSSAVGGRPAKGPGCPSRRDPLIRPHAQQRSIFRCPQAPTGCDRFPPNLARSTPAKCATITARMASARSLSAIASVRSNRILGTLPFKGQLLNAVAGWWFENTKAIAPNHVLSIPDPNAMVGHRVRAAAVEMVVRAYLTGSTRPAFGSTTRMARASIAGIHCPTACDATRNWRKPLLTPSTKAPQGDHDVSASREEILSITGMPSSDFDQAAQMAMALFAYGQRLCADRGLILVDTKYEFGKTPDGRIVVIDEIHTPDSSALLVQQ